TLARLTIKWNRSHIHPADSRWMDRLWATKTGRTSNDRPRPLAAVARLQCRLVRGLCNHRDCGHADPADAAPRRRRLGEAVDYCRSVVAARHLRIESSPAGPREPAGWAGDHRLQAPVVVGDDCL